MTQKKFQLLFTILFLSSPVFAQFTGFEEEIPRNFKSSDTHELALSSSYYKEGCKSLEWKFSPNSTLNVPSESAFTLENDNGITLWIYNEKPQQDSLRFEFYSPTGHVSYHFGFRLYAAGWRACWISFKHMQGDKQDKEIAGYRIVAPNRAGRVFIDRLTFPVKKINDRTPPIYRCPRITHSPIGICGIGAVFGNGNNTNTTCP